MLPELFSLQLLVSQTKERLSAARQSMRQKEKEAQTRLELLKYVSTHNYDHSRVAVQILSTLQSAELDLIINNP